MLALAYPQTPAPQVHSLEPLFFTKIATGQHIAIDRTRLCHSVFKGFKALGLGIIVPLAVRTTMVKPGKHQSNEKCADGHDERAKGNCHNRCKGQATNEFTSFFDNSKGL